MKQMDYEALMAAMKPKERKLLKDMLEGSRLILDVPDYPWQKEFYAAGKENPERMLMAANRVGKTQAGAYEDACHLTGIYPDWWEGKTFDRPILLWSGSTTSETSRDIVQKALLGGFGEKLGTGYVPRKRIIGTPTRRQSGIGEVYDKAKIRHKSGGISEVMFKTYDQGWKKWMGAEVDVASLDEEPEDYKIFTEALTRIFSAKGILKINFTPLSGETDLVRHFKYPETSGIYLQTATWDDAPHLDAAEKERLAASYPLHERESRTKGVPMMGEGRIFEVTEDDILVDPFEIPKHYARICGIDFGFNHPGAAAWLAWDRKPDCLYVTDCYRAVKQAPAYHAAAINARGKWIPVAWPHDGLQGDKRGGGEMIKQYRMHGVNALTFSARYDNDKGGGQDEWPVIQEINERMITGRFRVFSTCAAWREEFRNFHTKDGKIVALREDTLKASFYAVMMKRFAKLGGFVPQPQQMGRVA